MGTSTLTCIIQNLLRGWCIQHTSQSIPTGRYVTVLLNQQFSTEISHHRKNILEGYRTSIDLRGTATSATQYNCVFYLIIAVCWVSTRLFCQNITCVICSSDVNGTNWLGTWVQDNIHAVHGDITGETNWKAVYPGMILYYCRSIKNVSRFAFCISCYWARSQNNDNLLTLYY